MQTIIDHGPHDSKWMELRAKTDRQLIAYLNRKLAQAMRLAIEAAETRAIEPFEQASNIHEHVEQLLFALRDAETTQRRRIERELNRLRSMLDQPRMSPAYVCGAGC